MVAPSQRSTGLISRKFSITKKASESASAQHSMRMPVDLPDPWPGTSSGSGSSQAWAGERLARVVGFKLDHFVGSSNRMAFCVS